MISVGMEYEWNMDAILVQLVKGCYPLVSSKSQKENIAPPIRPQQGGSMDRSFYFDFKDGTK